MQTREYHHQQDAQAYPPLFDRGAHFVLTPGGNGKRPIWPAWQKRRPSLDLVLEHHTRGGGLGLIPWSVETTGLDVDKIEGNGLAVLIECTGPLATVDSHRGHHLYFRDTEPRGNATWRGFGCGGDVRGARGYLRLWPGAAAKLASALAIMPPDVGLWPADLFDAARVVVPETPPADRVAAPVEPPPLPEPETALVGFRNPSLFDHTRFWAYGQDRAGLTAAAWNDWVLSYALGINARFPTPLPVEEVRWTAYSVSTWIWDGGGPIDHSPPAQSRRGRKSVKVRRGLKPGRTVNKPEIAARDARIVRAVTIEGRTQAAVAAVEGITQQNVAHIVQRDAPLWASTAKSAEETRPWEAEGISKRTWYRRRAASRSHQSGGC